MNKEALSQVAALLGTTDKNVVISAVIQAMVNAGVSIDVAFDSLFGEGAYKRFAGEVYQLLRAKQGL